MAIEPNLPEVAPAYLRALASQRALDALFSSRFFVREEPLPDYGVDGSIELYRTVSGKTQATNRRAYYQLKSAAVPDIAGDGTVNYSLPTKNLNYLGENGPAFYALYVVSTDTLYFRWWHDIISDLATNRPDWPRHEKVTVRFSRVVDPTLLEEVALEVDAYADRRQQLRDGPKFIRSASARRVQALLLPTKLFVGRGPELLALKEATGPGAIVPIVGLPEAGKTELVAQYLGVEGLGISGRPWEPDMSLLVVDLSPRIGPRRVLRAVSYALGLPKMTTFGNFDDDEDVRSEQARGQLLQLLLPARVEGTRLVTVIESAQDCLSDAVERSDITELLRSDPLRRGTTIVVSRAGIGADREWRRPVHPDIRVGALDKELAEALLERLVGDPLTAVAVIREAVSIPELLLPGVLRYAGDRWPLAKKRGTSPTPIDVLGWMMEAGEEVVDQILADLACKQFLTDDGAVAPLGTLAILSVIALRPFDGALLERAKLSLPPLGALLDIGFLERVGAGYRLGALARHVMRRRLASALRPAAESRITMALGDGLTRLLDVADTASEEEELAEHVEAVEEGIAWLRREAPTEKTLEARLLAALLPRVIDDLVFPFAATVLEDVASSAVQASDPGHLRAAVAELTVMARLGKDPDRFLEQFGIAVDAIAAAQVIPWQALRTGDIAGYIGKQRHRRYRELLEIRLRLRTRLSQLSASETHSGSVKWATSWLLNAAMLAAELGQMEEARAVGEEARAMVVRLPAPRTPTARLSWLGLRLRLAELDFRLATSDGRARALRGALDLATTALETSAGHPRWLHMYLRSAKRFSDELGSDAERQRAVDEAYAKLQAQYGTEAGWPLSVRAQMAALVRDVGGRQIDRDLRVEAAEAAVGLMLPVVDQAEAGREPW